MENKKEWHRIGKLESLSNVPRRTIHFYVKQGLLHKPKKTGKTMAYYDSKHLHKLSYIKNAKLQGLPLIAIKQKIADLESSNQNAFTSHLPVTFFSRPKSFRPEKRKEEDGRQKNTGAYS